MRIKDTFFSKKSTLNCRGHLLETDVPLVMGIINITPDSFYDGGRYTETKHILDRASRCIREGADILDIGGYSSRPGGNAVSEKEEMQRLDKALPQIRKAYPEAIISVDTFRSKIAKTVIADYEVDMINDISAGEMDKKMIPTIVEMNIPYIMMHMKGTPATMQQNPVYDNVVEEITAFFAEKTTVLHKLGLKDLIIDPGFGFGKTPVHNFELLNKLDNFKQFGIPLMVGLSRKSMIYKSLSVSPEEALNGTSVLHTIALLNGADILRVHDVKEAKEVITLTQMVKGKPL